MGLRTAPEDVALLNLKALAYFNNGYYPEAIPLFEKVLELGETAPHVYKKLGYCYFKEWDFTKAKSTYQQLMQIMNYEADAYFGLGEYIYRRKN